MTIDVAVVGGGVSGLATAYDLRRRGYRVAVLERQVHPGGNAVSERIGGFLMEHGPSSVSAASAEAVALSASLGLAGSRCELSPEVRYRYLCRGGGLHRIAAHPLGFVTSDYLSLSARLRMLTEILVPPGPGFGDETVAAFWSRRFGREFSDRVIDPLVGGLFAGRAGEVSMAAVFPALLEMERRYGSITRGVLARRRAGGRMPGRRLFSWRDGVGSLPKSLAAALGSAVRTGIAVRRIRPASGGYRIEAGSTGSVEARAVVIATQPHVTASLLEGLDGAGAEAAAAIDAPPLAVVFLGYRREQIEHALDGLGFLTASGANRSLSGALFCSTMFPERAPEGHVALAGYLGGARKPDLARAPREELIALTNAEFCELLGVKGEPVLARVRQWPRGLPQYQLSHAGLIDALRGAEQRQGGLFLTGNYFAGVSIAACISKAMETSARVHGFLTSTAANPSTSLAARAKAI